MTFNHTPRRRFTDQQRLAFFEKHGGICHLCGLKIKPLERWEVEHVIARELLGPMADEDDNLRPAHVECHKAKTKQDRADIARSNRVRAKHIGAHQPGSLPGKRIHYSRARGVWIDRATGEIVEVQQS